MIPLFANYYQNVIIILTTTVVIIIIYLKWNYTYWERKGLQTLSRPSLFFGNTKELFLAKKSIGETFQDAYHYFRSKGLKHGGVYMGWQKIYVPADPELIKTMMIKDFPYFFNHLGYVHEENDPLSANLINLKDLKWKHLRLKLSPAFTFKKMKMMFDTITDCAKNLKGLIDKEQNPVEIREIFGRYTTDVIGSCAFGIECNSLKNPNAEFRKMGKRIFDNSYFESLNFTLQFVLPKKFLDLIKYKANKSDVEKFFMKIVEETVNYREKNNIYRKDFLHLLLQLKNRGKVENDDEIKNDIHQVAEESMTLKQLAAQVYIFFVAGFETSSTAMTLALFQLSQHQEIQDKLREEINSVLDRHNGNITYEAIIEMTYMDKVLNETLRMYPPVPVITRECTKDYCVPGTDVIIEKGTKTMLPVLGLHSDPKYYPNPEKFDPERFSEEQKRERPAMTWLPFGDGPRLCLGKRFAQQQIKVGLTVLLKDFKMSLNRKTKVPLEIGKTNFTLRIDNCVWLDFDPLK